MSDCLRPSSEVVAMEHDGFDEFPREEGVTVGEPSLKARKWR